MDDTKRIDDIDQLKELSKLYTSPCIKCETDDGCPSMAMCKVYQEFKERCRTLKITSMGKSNGKKSAPQ